MGSARGWVAGQRNRRHVLRRRPHADTDNRECEQRIDRHQLRAHERIHAPGDGEPDGEGQSEGVTLFNFYLLPTEGAGRKGVNRGGLLFNAAPCRELSCGRSGRHIKH